MALEAAPGEPPTTGPGSSRNAASHGKLTNGVGGEDMVGNGHPPANGHTFADLRMWFQERLREETTASTTRLRQELSRQLEEYHRELMDAIASAKQLAAARALRQASPEMVTTGCSGIPSSNAGQQLAHILPEPRNLPARSEAGNLPASSEADNAADNAAQDVESEPEVEGGGFAALRKSKHSTSLIFVSGELPDWDPSKSREVSEYSGTTSQVMRKRTKAELAKTMRRKGGPTQYKTGVFAELAHQRKEIKGHFLARIVNSQAFEYASALIIILCTLTMTIEIQYAGLQSGYALSVPSYGKSAADTWPGADFAFQILEPAYNTLFLLELILRIAVMKIAALRSAWIWFDFVLVSLGWLDQFGLLDVGLDPMILRVVRLVRMVRILKVLKQVRAFETLFLLIRSIQASVGALVWSFLLLWTVQIAMAILLCQLLREYIDDPTKDEDLRKEVFKYFGTFTNAVLTMFEITLSNSQAGHHMPTARVICPLVCAAVSRLAVFAPHASAVAVTDDHAAQVSFARNPSAGKMLRREDAMMEASMRAPASKDVAFAALKESRPTPAADPPPNIDQGMAWREHTRARPTLPPLEQRCTNKTCPEEDTGTGSKSVDIWETSEDLSRSESTRASRGSRGSKMSRTSRRRLPGGPVFRPHYAGDKAMDPYYLDEDVNRKQWARNRHDQYAGVSPKDVKHADVELAPAPLSSVDTNRQFPLEGGDQTIVDENHASGVED